MLQFKSDSQTNHHKDVGNIPSVQDSSTGARHNINLQSQLLGQENANSKKHSKKYYADIDKAKS